MNHTQKIGFFFLAVFTMACLAIGSVMMAERQAGIAAGLFVLAFAIAGVGFTVKRRIRSRKQDR